jgi:hypothetical protein
MHGFRESTRHFGIRRAAVDRSRAEKIQIRRARLGFEELLQFGQHAFVILRQEERDGELML